jgi:predicted amidohydrolase
MNHADSQISALAAGPGPRLRIALAQFAPVLGDVGANVARAAALASEAARAGAGLIVLPELALTGYFVKDLAFEVARPITSADFAPLAAASADLAIVAGFVEQGADHALYNAAGFWQGGAARFVQRKVYLPTYGLFDEGRYVARGQRLRAFDTPLGRLGLLVCEDIWHASTVYVEVQDGAEMIVVIAASPTREAGGEDASRSGSIWLDLLRAHAVIHGVHVVFVNRVGFEDGVNFWGGSRIIAPSGALVAAAAFFDESLVYGEVDRRDLLRERMRSHHVWDEDAALTLGELARALERRREREEPWSAGGGEEGAR